MQLSIEDLQTGFSERFRSRLACVDSQKLIQQRKRIAAAMREQKLRSTELKEAILRTVAETRRIALSPATQARDGTSPALSAALGRE